MVLIILQRVGPLTGARGEEGQEKLKHICIGHKNNSDFNGFFFNSIFNF